MSRYISGSYRGSAPLLETKHGTKTSIVSDGVDHKVLNVHLYNSQQDPIQCEFDSTFSRPILDGNPSDWYCAVSKMSIPGTDIPLSIFPQDPVPYFVAMNYSGSNYTGVLVWNNNGDTFDGTSRNIYNFQEMLSIMNVANQVVFQALKAAHPECPATTGPYFYYTAETQLITFACQTGCYTPELTGGITYMINELLLPFVEGIYSVAIHPQVYGFDQLYFAFLVGDWGNNLNTYNGQVRRILTEEYDSQFFWKSFDGIVVTTTVPINPNQNIVSNNITGLAGDFILQNILIEYYPKIVGVADYRGNIYYEPTAEYFLQNIITSAPLQSFNFKIYWKDTLGDIHPLKLFYSDTCILQIVFRRKTFNGVPMTELVEELGATKLNPSSR